MDIDKLKKDTVRAVIFTANNLKIEGEVYVTPGIRLSDELNTTQRKFLIVDNPQISSTDPQLTRNPKVVFVNKDGIFLACPYEDE